MNMNSYNCCVGTTHEYEDVTSLSSLVKLVGEESRLKILCILRQGEHCVCEIERHVGLSQSLISHHLKDLKEAGILTVRKDGQWVRYSLTDRGTRITEILFALKGFGKETL